MKKQEMINAILQEERILWSHLQYCIEKLGVNDDATEFATARWAVIKNLMDELKIVKK